MLVQVMYSLFLCFEAFRSEIKIKSSVIMTMLKRTLEYCNNHNLAGINHNLRKK